MFQLLMIVHIAICIFLIGVVLLQQGKGADAGATFGGSSNTVFGASGASTILTKATTAAAIAFIVTALFLVKMYPAGITGSGAESDILSNSVMSQGVDTESAGAGPTAVQGDGTEGAVGAESSGEAGDATAGAASGSVEDAAGAASETTSGPTE